MTLITLANIIIGSINVDAVRRQLNQYTTTRVCLALGLQQHTTEVVSRNDSMASTVVSHTSPLTDGTRNVVVWNLLNQNERNVSRTMHSYLQIDVYNEM